MQAAVLVVLLGVCLLWVHGADDHYTPDLLSMVTKLQTQVQTLQTQAQTLQSKVQNLESSQRQQQNSPSVAFFATFPRNLQGGSILTEVASTFSYTQVVTNVGNGFNAGVFRAPVKGLYVFHLTMYATVITPPFGPILKKNTEELLDPLILHKVGNKDPATRIAVVTLEVGDTVFVEIPANTLFADTVGGQLNSFSGFLISPM